MKTSDKIIEILKSDPQAQTMINKLNLMADATPGLTKAQYIGMREFTLMLAMANNPEAMKVMSDSCWNQLNKE